MQGTGSFTRAGSCLAGDAVSIGGNEDIKDIEKLFDSREIIEVSQSSRKVPGGQGLNDGLDATEDPAIGRDQLHGSQTSFTADPWETVQGSGLLKIEQFHGQLGEPAQKMVGGRGAKTAQTVIDQDIFTRRPREEWHDKIWASAQDPRPAHKYSKL